MFLKPRVYFQKKKIKENHLLYGLSSDYFLNFSYIIYTKESGYITKEQLESARRVIVRGTKRKAVTYVVSLSYYPLTYLSKMTRMGKGKGKVKKLDYFAKVSAGVPLLMVHNIVIADISQYKNYKILLYRAASKLPLNVGIRLGQV